MPGEPVPTFWRDARRFASVLVAMTAAYYLVVAVDNVTNPSSNWVFVQGVVSGDGVPPDSGFEWRFVDATWFQVVVYVMIIVGEAVAGAVLAVAAVSGWRTSADAIGWQRGQRLTLLGTAIGLGVFFLGFVTIGGNWWVMYLNSSWNGLQPAFQNSVLTLLTVVVVVVVAGLSRPAPPEERAAGR